MPAALCTDQSPPPSDRRDPVPSLRASACPPAAIPPQNPYCTTRASILGSPPSRGRGYHSPRHAFDGQPLPPSERPAAPALEADRGASRNLKHSDTGSRRPPVASCDPLAVSSSLQCPDRAFIPALSAFGGLASRTRTRPFSPPRLRFATTPPLVELIPSRP